MIVQVRGETKVKIDDDFFRQRHATMSAIDCVGLTNTPIQRLIRVAAESGVCDIFLARTTIMLVLISQGKLPPSDCIVGHVLKSVWGIEEDEHWIRAA